MGKISRGICTRGFREKAVKLTAEGGLFINEAIR